MKKCKLIPLFISIIFFFSFGRALIGINVTDHHCSDNKCSLCCIIRHLDELVHSCGQAEKPAALGINVMILMTLLLMMYKVICSSTTLITLKVKLSD